MTVAEGREARRGVVGDILRPWKALRSADEALCFIAVELAAIGGLDGVWKRAVAAPKKTPAAALVRSTGETTVELFAS